MSTTTITRHDPASCDPAAAATRVGGAPQLKPNDRGLRALPDRAEAALAQDAYRGCQLGECLGDDAFDLGQGKGAFEQPAHRFRGVAPAPVVAHDPVAHFDDPIRRGAPLVTCAPDEGAAAVVAPEHHEVEPPPRLIRVLPDPGGSELEGGRV